MSHTYRAFAFGGVSDTGSGGIGALVTDVAALVTLQSTMNGVGAGDNSTNVTTMGTDLTTLSTDLTAFTAGNTGAYVLVNVDVSKVKTVSTLRMILNRICDQALADGKLTP